MTETETIAPGFRELGLPEILLRVLDESGYEAPTPIQARTIPPLLEGRDLIGQAETGSGKTAAFALPILSQIEIERREPQALVLAPTRELAIQVAESFQHYAKHLPGFHVLPIYGGQAYPLQLRPLKRGVHVVVGTPGRVMDHMRRGSLKLDSLRCLVLDEADEMLRMGFLEDVTWVLEQTPPERQIVLFSATMPPPIRRIAQKHLSDPVEVQFQVRATAAESIRQRYWIVSGAHKLDALTRILEVEETDGMIVFVRTKTATVELAERLEARGLAAAALNGDIPQNQRERIVEQLKKGKIDVLVATDVAARGLDVERISHVVNYDAPHDLEGYVHRIGRTGRAGRSGDAIIFLAPRERHVLRSLERATQGKLEQLTLPTTDDVNQQRMTRFKQRIGDTIESDENLELFEQLVGEFLEESEHEPLQVAAALARMAQGDQPLLLTERPKFEREAARREDSAQQRERQTGRPREREGGMEGRVFRVPPTEEGMERFRVEVGHVHGVQPGNLVGAIAGESGLEGRLIGRIELYQDFSTIDLPEGMPDFIFKDLSKLWVCGQQLRMVRLNPREIEELSLKPKGGPRKSGGFSKGGPRPGGYGKPGPRPGGFGKGGPRKGGFGGGGKSFGKGAGGHGFGGGDSSR
ncbi:MAG: DEAD/DEAH box helicase [Planctomycetes bacterium]|nr:DEAD/DEAH box helicase [Planctomycetota bacterium]